MDDLISKLYMELGSYLFTLIKNRLYTGCPEDQIYDCLNDVFETALQKQSDPKFQQNPRGWLIITARNKVDNYNRKALRRLSHYQFDCDMTRIYSKKDMIEDLTYQMALENNIFGQLMDHLSEKERRLYTLRFEERLKPEEIASKLQTSKTNVNTSLSRLKIKIKKYICAAVQ
ncbi:MAG: sigma-70 family RNA polymerase sigma factor [Lachnospiraceae bacterium]|nr:sigma-70 family RNA polymerase sigma factor [Lachnospiraceae bacterium]